MTQREGASARGARRVPFESIPVIDIGPMFGAERGAMEGVAAALDDACRQVGFFYIANHGVPAGVVERAYGEAARFFAAPLEARMRIHYKNARNHVRGYVPLWQTHADREVAADFHDAFELGLELPVDDPDYAAGNNMYGPNQWPDDLPGFREGIYAYYEAILGLGPVLFRAFAIALGLPDGYFDDKIAKPMGQMRVIHYPRQETLEKRDQWGIGAHTDYECFTILSQDGAGGLQVRNSAGAWIEAPPIPGTFVVNVGDMMARWTNDLYASTLHRVLNRSGRERYSLAFFYGSNYDVVVTCLPSCRDSRHPPRYPPTRAGEWTEANLRSTYFSD